MQQQQGQGRLVMKVMIGISKKNLKKEVFMNHTMTSSFQQDQLLNQVPMIPYTSSSHHPKDQSQRQVQRSQ
eukprot:12906666-Prorocentrum_lima.AAC.1